MTALFTIADHSYRSHTTPCRHYTVGRPLTIDGAATYWAYPRLSNPELSNTGTAQIQLAPQPLILMKFAEEKNQNRIKSYSTTAITLDESSHTLPVVLHNGRIVTTIELTLNSNIDLTTVYDIITPQVDIVLLGTGSTLVFPKQEVRYRFLNAGIGLELMNTAAACRTYNILIYEDRNVLALLYPAMK